MTTGPADGRATVLVVDDSPEVIALINGILRHEFRVRAAPSGESALKLLAGGHGVDLVLLDVLMPHMGGHEVLRRIMAMPHMAGVPVIFLSGSCEEADQTAGLRMGAADFIAKPVHGAGLLARVRVHVDLKRSREQLRRLTDPPAGPGADPGAERSSRLDEQVHHLTALCLVSLAESGDHDAGRHVLRTQHYVRLLANALQPRERFREVLTPRNVDLMLKAAPLHDIGNASVPQEILRHPGRLNPAEFELMKRHCADGCEAIARAESALSFATDFLTIAKEIVGSHHERWDGSGYPLGLAGDAIPVSARMMAVADVYDALTSTRPYKAALSHVEAVDLLARAGGVHFDPEVVDAFVAHSPAFEQIALHHCNVLQ